MYSTHIEQKFVVDEKFNRTLKNKIYKYMTSISKNMYIDKLNDSKCNDTYYRTIKMMPVDVNSSKYISFNEEVGNHLRISKYKNITLQSTLQFLLLKKLKTLCHGHILII